MSVTVNQFVTLFPRGTRIKVHVIFAGNKKSERLNDKDFGVWGDGEYYGITRHPIGECDVHEARMLKPLIKNHPYDLDVWAFEPDYCDNMKKKRMREWCEGCGVCPEDKMDPENCEIYEAAHSREVST